MVKRIFLVDFEVLIGDRLSLYSSYELAECEELAKEQVAKKTFHKVEITQVSGLEDSLIIEAFRELEKAGVAQISISEGAKASEFI